MSQEISILVRAKDLFTSVFNKAGAAAKSIGHGLAEGAKIAAGAAAAILAAGYKLVTMYQADARAEAKRAQAVKNSGNAAGLTTSQYEAQAAALSKLSGMSKPVITSAQGIVAAFSEIKGPDVFKRTMSAALDMSAAMQKTGDEEGSLEQVSLMLGKALKDPAEGLGRLTRYGINFSDAQKIIIKDMQETGRLGEAQSMVLQMVEDRFRGAAEASHKADLGFKDIVNTLRDMGAQLGKAIFDNETFRGVLKDVGDAIKDFAESGELKQWADDISNAVKETVGWIRKIGPAVAEAAPATIKGVSTVLEDAKTGWAAANAFLKTPIGQNPIDEFNRVVDEHIAESHNEEDPIEAGKRVYRERKQAEAKRKADEAAKAAQKESELKAAADAAAAKATADEKAKADLLLALKILEKKVQKEIADETEGQTQAEIINSNLAEQQKNAAAAQKAIQDQTAKGEELKKKLISEYIAGKKEEAARDKTVADEAERVAKIEAKEKRGIKLGKAEGEFIGGARDRNWELVAADLARNKAKADAAAAQEEIKLWEKQQAENSNKALIELALIRQKMMTLLQAPKG